MNNLPNSVFVVDANAPMQSARARFLYCVFGAVSILGFISIPAQLLEHWIAPESAPTAKEAPAKRQAEVSPAPVWSRRCESKGKTSHATQADGGKWNVTCTGRSLRT